MSAVKIVGRVLLALVALPGLLVAFAVLTAVRCVAEWISDDAQDWR